MSPTTGSPSAPREFDIVVTADIPLAGRCVRKRATVIGPTGKPFSEDSIGMALATRDLLTELRSAGATTRGPPPLTRQDLSRFLSALDLAVTRLQRKLSGQSLTIIPPRWPRRHAPSTSRPDRS